MAVANMARNLFLEYEGLPVRVMVAGWEDEGGKEDQDLSRSHAAENEEAGREAGQDEEGESRRSGRPRLFWLDSLGAVSPLPYAAHGEATAFLMAFLDQQYHQLEVEGGKGGGPEGGKKGGGGKRRRRLPSLEEAVVILERCYEELERRFLVNAGGGFQVKVIDREGVRTLVLPSTGRKRKAEEEGGGGGRVPPPVVVSGGMKRGG
ncbi:20s proteasome subunit [Nannochloropsis oceanica]